MLNTIRADFYRLFRSKAFYITQLLLVILIVGTVASQKMATIMEVSKDKASLADANPAWTGVQSVLNLSSMATFLVYFCLSLFVITIGYDLSRGMLKNMLTSGISRERFFISKYIVFLLVTAFQFVLYYGTTFIVASLLHGVGKISLDFLKLFSGGVALQFLLLQATFAIGICILYFTFATVWPVLGVIAIPFAIGVASFTLPKVDWLYQFAFSNQVAYAMVPQPTTEVVKLVGSAVGVLVILLGLAFYNFKKKEL
ncbi:ABC transporter permease [Lactococcus kimchii]|uniref:ABC transporter permease n=1 Tax=Lactococcus sp. S-13 TaxID=2507158 RepID=UPI001023D4B8|nr:ABC transporter permease [Lactococcus sp. S-13]RZI48710.1 hypothetical protein EQJ87_04165 [Lactococcus sp. S-13]